MKDQRGSDDHSFAGGFLRAYSGRSCRAATMSCGVTVSGSWSTPRASIRRPRPHRRRAPVESSGGIRLCERESTDERATKVGCGRTTPKKQSRKTEPKKTEPETGPKEPSGATRGLDIAQLHDSPSSALTGRPPAKSTINGAAIGPLRRGARTFTHGTPRR